MGKMLYLIYICYGLDAVAWSLCFPTFPGLFSELGISNAVVGIAASLSSFIIFFCSPFLGNLSDLYGRGRMLQISTLGSFTGLAISATTKNPTLFVLGRIIPSFVKCNLPVSQALIADVHKGTEVAKSCGTLSAAGSLGFIIGPIIGGQLSLLSPRLPLQLACAVYLIIIIVLFGVPNTSMASTKFKKSESEMKKNNMKPLYLAFYNSQLIRIFHHRFAFLTGYAVYESLFGQLLKEKFRLNGAGIGWLLSYCGLVSILVNSVILRWITKIVKSPATLLLPLTILQTFALCCWGWSESVVYIMISAAILCLTSNLFLNFTQSIITSVSQQHEDSFSAGALMGIGATVERGARMIAPLLGGYSLQYYGSFWLGITAASTCAYCAISLAIFPLGAEKRKVS